MSVDLTPVLRATPVFASLPAREIEALAAVAVEEVYRSRQFVFLEGDPARWLCAVRTGRVKIVKHSTSGKDVVLELLGPGEVFGGVAVIERRPYPAAAQALEPSVIVKIPAETLIALAERHPSVIREMALVMGRRLRAAHDAVRVLAVEPVEARLASNLLRIADREGVRGPRGLEVPFHLTRQSLADMSGTTVETAIRIVGRWLRDGLVEDEGGRLVVRKAEALRQLADGEKEG
jgi:CRP/FNR family transcriptional regulator